MADQFGPKRPVGITIVAFLVWIGAAIDILASILLFTAASDPEFAEQFGGTAALIAASTVSLLLGVIVIVAAIGLLRGNPVSRIAVTVLEALSALASIVIGVMNPAGMAGEILSALVAVAAITLLWMPESTRYFRGLAPGEPVAD
ncbi:hypothetical protein [Agromyces sp. SYSU T00194]|uniref:hypothetical protein n=1 Tax=Agromyces chitinivorans TaxID=3158560 RepID=UPI003395B9C4